MHKEVGGGRVRYWLRPLGGRSPYWPLIVSVSIFFCFLDLFSVFLSVPIIWFFLYLELAPEGVMLHFSIVNFLFPSDYIKTQILTQAPVFKV